MDPHLGDLSSGTLLWTDVSSMRRLSLILKNRTSKPYIGEQHK